jgi:hypothetical protein
MSRVRGPTTARGAPGQLRPGHGVTVIAQNLSGASGCGKGRPSRSGRSRTSPPPDREPMGAGVADVAATAPVPGRTSAVPRAWPRSPATRAVRPGPSWSAFSRPDGNTRMPEWQYHWLGFPSSGPPRAQAHSPCLHTVSISLSTSS